MEYLKIEKLKNGKIEEIKNLTSWQEFKTEKLKNWKME